MTFAEKLREAYILSEKNNKHSAEWLKLFTECSEKQDEVVALTKKSIKNDIEEITLVGEILCQLQNNPEVLPSEQIDGSKVVEWDKICAKGKKLSDKLEVSVSKVHELMALTDSARDKALNSRSEITNLTRSMLAEMRHHGSRLFHL